MNSLPGLGKAKAYIDVETNLFPSQPSPIPHVEDGPFITISREAGTGGSTLASVLLRELESRKSGDLPSWTVFDSELVEQMLTEANLPSRLARFLPEDRIPGIVAAVGEVVGLHPNLWTLVARTNETVKRLAMLGHAVIVGRGGNFATEGVANGLDIRLVGSETTRAKRTAQARGCSVLEATLLNRKIDNARRDYVLSAFDRDINDTTAYDLVFNVDTFSMAEAVDATLAVLARRQLVSSRS
jgi:hypothetical protein